jgi:glycosyltransferase involved in cell wall biosynthesis
MKIGYVSTYPPQECGIATYTEYLVHGLQMRDPALEIEVVAERDAASVKLGRFEVNPCWDRNGNYVESIISNTMDADVVHIQHEYGIYNLDGRLPTLLERLNAEGKSTIVTIHCVRPTQFSANGAKDEQFVKKIAERAHEVIVHSDSQKAILRRLGIPSKKIHSIPHGVALSAANKKDSRVRLQLPEEGKIITVFGFIHPFKGLDTSLEVLKEIRKEVKDAYLFIAGGLPPNPPQGLWDYVTLLRERITELGLTESVIFPNQFVPDEEIPYIFGASDIVLFAHSHEDRSVSGAIQLAIGAKKPVIAYRIPKFELVKKISDELLILPENVSAIAKTAIRLFTDKEFERYILDRTEEYRMITSWSEIAGKHLDLYRGIQARKWSESLIRHPWNVPLATLGKAVLSGKKLNVEAHKAIPSGEVRISH